VKELEELTKKLAELYSKIAQLELENKRLRAKLEEVYNACNI
jgi:regulator of replication initiation timing